MRTLMKIGTIAYNAALRVNNATTEPDLTTVNTELNNGMKNAKR
jgi:hypothetical protein